MKKPLPTERDMERLNKTLDALIEWTSVIIADGGAKPMAMIHNTDAFRHFAKLAMLSFAGFHIEAGQGVKS